MVRIDVSGLEEMLTKSKNKIFMSHAILFRESPKFR